MLAVEGVETDEEEGRPAVLVPEERTRKTSEDEDGTEDAKGRINVGVELGVVRGL